MKMKAKAVDKMEFEEALEELEEIVSSLEDRNIKLKDAVAAFERGKKLHDHCALRLKDAENKIRLATANDDEFEDGSNLVGS